MRLAQLFGSLVANASKYSEAGDVIGLEAIRQGSEVVVTVTDHGIGIPPEHQARIFDMFTRGPSSGQDGLGVGLTLADHLARLHGGSIEVMSDGAGQGSRFRVHLPVVVGASGDTAPRPRTEHPHPPQRILIVDDNRDAADALAGLLELDGNDVHVAHDGEVALAMAEDLRPQAILLDIGLPSLNGYEVAERIRATEWGASILLLALTGWGHSDDRAKSTRAGFDEHLIKPVEIETLTELLAGHAAER